MDTLVAPVALLIIFVVTTYYVLVPFLSEVTYSTGSEEYTRYTALELRKVNLYKQLREAEFEREMGLTDTEDYDRTRNDLMGEVAEVIRELEGNSNGPESGLQIGPGAALSSCPKCQAELDEGVRFCAQCGTQVGQLCPKCGAQTQDGDRFCAACGRGLLN